MSAIQSILSGYGSSAAGGSDPSSIGSGLLIWNQNGAGLWDDHLMTDPAVISDTVQAWEDQSGNANHLTNNLDDAPVLEADGALHWDGVNDVLTATSAITLKPTTVFFHVKFDQVGTIQVLFGGGSGLSLFTNTTTLNASISGGAAIATSAVTLSGATDYRIIFTYSNTGVYTFYVNGATQGTGTNDQTIASAAPVLGILGGQYMLDGIVKDWGAYDNVLSGPNITLLDDYLASL